MLRFGGKLKSASAPVGVALTAHDVRLVQRVSGGFVFEHEPLAEDIDVAGPAYHVETQRAISTALRRGKFTGKQAVSALPAELLRYKTLRLPPMPEEDLAQAVAWEAAERFQLTDDQSLQHYSAGAVNQGNEQREEIILLAAEKNAVYDHAVAVRRAGLQPTAIDATGAAIGRVLGAEGQSSLVVHLGPTVAEVVGLRGDQVIFDKPVELKQEQDTIDLTALSREIALCMRYLSVTFGIHKPDAAWVCGEGVSDSIAQHLSAGLNTTFQTADQASTLNAIDCPEDDAQAWIVALGLALRDQAASAKRGAA